MRKLYFLVLTVFFILAVPIQTFSQFGVSAGLFDNSKSDENTDQSSDSGSDSGSGFFRAGGTENPDDGGGSTKEDAPSDAGNGILIASAFFAASYMLIKIRRDKKK